MLVAATLPAHHVEAQLPFSTNHRSDLLARAIQSRPVALRGCHLLFTLEVVLTIPGLENLSLDCSLTILGTLASNNTDVLAQSMA